MKFDPQSVLNAALEPAMVRLYLARRLAGKLKPALIGIDDVSVFTQAAFVGALPRVAPLVPQALELLTTAIKERVPVGGDPSQHLQDLHWARAVARWVASNDAAKDDWREAARYELLRWTYEGRPWGRNEVVTYGVEDYVLLSCLAGEHAQAVKVFEEWIGKTDVKGLLRTSNPRSFCHLVSLAKSGVADIDDAKLFEVGRKVLKAKLCEPWLGGGQMNRAAAWMKLVHSFGPYRGEPAERMVLRAYEDMPDVQVPDGVGQLLAQPLRAVAI
jgi:hypothetical protein